MSTNSLKGLKREDFLRMLREQELEIEALKGEISTLREQLHESESSGLRLEQVDLEIISQNSDRIIGSIADSALAVSGIFEAAQGAADAYITELRHLSERAETSRRELEAEARAEADRLVTAAKAECAMYESRKSAIVEEAWQDAKKRLDDYYEAHKGLQELFGSQVTLPRADIQKRYENECEPD